MARVVQFVLESFLVPLKKKDTWVVVAVIPTMLGIS